MEKAKITKKYSNGEVTIVWKPVHCIHSAICWKHPEGLIKVFNPSEKPWIKPNDGTTEEIINQVKKCPSGALSYFMNESGYESKIVSAASEDKNTVNKEVDTKIELIKNGPIMVSVTYNVIGAIDTKKVRNNTTYLCRCGGSANKPFCDGTHSKIKFIG